VEKGEEIPAFDYQTELSVDMHRQRQRQQCPKRNECQQGFDRPVVLRNAFQRSAPPSPPRRTSSSLREREENSLSKHLSVPRKLNHRSSLAIDIDVSPETKARYTGSTVDMIAKVLKDLDVSCGVGDDVYDDSDSSVSFHDEEEDEDDVFFTGELSSVPTI